MRILLSQKNMHRDKETRGEGVYTRELAAALKKQFPKDDISPTGKPDLIHYSYFDPFFLTLRIARGVPTIVTIHDLIPLRFPTHFPSGIKGKLKWWLQRISVQHAAHVITDSEASKKDIMTLIGIESSKISVIPLGPNDANPLPLTLTKKIAQSYNLPAKYLLYVGDINWNKNIPGLIHAFNLVDDPQFSLVLVGKVFADKPNIPEWHSIEQAIASSPKKDRIHMLGYIPTHHLSVLYTQATLYIQPSWYEGFGLTILEAMKFGCPVATSDRGSLPEIGGNAVAYFDPASNMAPTIETLLKTPAQLRKLTELGLQRATAFTWERTARLTHKVYENVLASRT